MINNLIITSISKTLLTTERRLPFPNILKYREHREKLTAIWKTTLSETYRRVQLVCMKVQAHSSSEPSDAFDKSRFLITFLAILGVTDICSFTLVLEGKTRKEILESSRSEFSEKFLVNSFGLSDAEDNTSGKLNRGGIVDLPLLRTLLTIRQKYRKRSFWEVMNFFCFSSICKFGSFKNPFPTITSLSEL